MFTFRWAPQLLLLQDHVLRFVQVSGALRFLRVRSFQFTRQGPVHPTPFFRRATGQGHFWFFPLRCFACFLGGNWQGQVLLGVTVIFLFVSASPPACCDCSVMRRIALGPCVTQVAFLSRFVSADLHDVVFQ